MSRDDGPGGLVWWRLGVCVGHGLSVGLVSAMQAKSLDAEGCKRTRGVDALDGGDVDGAVVSWKVGCARDEMRAC